MGAVMVLLIVTSLLQFWDKNFSIASQSRVLDELDSAANRAMTHLVETGGSPLDWQTRTDHLANAKAIGLVYGVASHPLVLNKSKLLAFAADATDPNKYDAVKSVLGLSNAEFKWTVYRIG
ncbi:MAG: hypothetical protein Q7R47_03630, partial [Candidatus Diapherotrites archaeon]|nr:hypothetical protein [Candidatus Diapherotrites archaeon]